MKYLTSKEIKKHILNYNDLDVLYEYLEINYKETIEGIMNALFILAKNQSQNKQLIDDLLWILKSELINKNSEYLKKMIGPIIDFQNKTTRLNIKERIMMKKTSIELQSLFNEIHIKINNENHMKKQKCLEFLIFHDKNISMLTKFLKEEDINWHDRKDMKENIFDVVLTKYIHEKDEQEIDYLYHVILVFLNSKYKEKILEKKENYLNLLNSIRNRNNPHITRIIKLLDPNHIFSPEELEERYKIHFNFPNIILSEVYNLKEKKLPRKDFTYQKCITIDGESSLCFDDALFMEKNIDGTYTLYAHIVDIPSLIPYSSIIREEASYRGETLYLKDKNILLYPPSISNDMCSLIPNNVRNTITYIFTLDKNFNIIPNSFQITPGKIIVRNRLTYEEVDALIEKEQGRSTNKMLSSLADFANVRRKETKEKEVYREYENIINEREIHESLKINTSLSANIVHEAMILVNYYVSKYMKEYNYPYIYRKLNIPSINFLEEQLKKIKSLDLKLENNKAFLSLLKDSYIKPIYCEKPTYHNGLNLECYSHSTSPARRYIDSLGQYIIHDLVIDQNICDKNIETWEYRIHNSVQYINDKKEENELFGNEYNYLKTKRLIKEK